MCGPANYHDDMYDKQFLRGVQRSKLELELFDAARNGDEGRTARARMKRTLIVLCLIRDLLAIDTLL